MHLRYGFDGHSSLHRSTFCGVLNSEYKNSASAHIAINAEKLLMRDTEYATEIKTAELNNCRIERLYVKGEGQEEIRFSWWPDGRMANRPLDLPEEELLPLLAAAMKAGVFSDTFLRGLKELLDSRLP
jgi:hypothetical protein